MILYVSARVFASGQVYWISIKMSVFIVFSPGQGLAIKTTGRIIAVAGDQCDVMARLICEGKIPGICTRDFSGWLVCLCVCYGLPSPPPPPLPPPPAHIHTLPRLGSADAEIKVLTAGSPGLPSF